MAPVSPRHLRPSTRQWFASVVETYNLEPHHLKLLQAAAESWDAMQDAREALRKRGRVFTDRYGQPRARPEVGMERDAKIVFARLLRELALDVDAPDAPRARGLSGSD